MFYPYSLWNMYYSLRIMHGMYITYSMCMWLLGSLSGTVMYMMSFIPNPYLMKQLEDHDRRKQIKLNDID